MHEYLFIHPCQPVVRATGRPTGSKDSAPPSPDRKSNGRVAAGSTNGSSSAKKASSASNSGSVTADKNRDRRRGSERKEGDRKDGERSARGPEGERRDRGGRDRTSNAKVCTYGFALFQTAIIITVNSARFITFQSNFFLPF